MSSAIRDFAWLNSHYSELQRNYPSMYVAVKDDRVVAYGKEFGKVYDDARDRVGEEFMIDYILSGEPFVLKVELQDNRNKLQKRLGHSPWSTTQARLSHSYL